MMNDTFNGFVYGSLATPPLKHLYIFPVSETEWDKVCQIINIAMLLDNIIRFVTYL